MLEPPIPHDEQARIEALQFLEILDTGTEERFDRITKLASLLLDVPICVVSLVDTDRQWFKSCQGLDASETSREVSFCGHTILQQETLVVQDASKDDRFADNPLVLGEPNIRFYAGHPLATREGYRVGTLCVIDRSPKHPSKEQLQVLKILATVLESELQSREQLRRYTMDLERANEKIVASADNKARFLANMSHELRTPMMSILGYVDLLDSESVSETDRREYATIIKSSGDQLLSLVNDLLDHSKVEAGKLSIERIPLDLAALLNEVRDLMRIRADEKGIRLNISTSGAIPRTIQSDPTRMRQILINLLGNAIKFTKSGHVELAARIEHGEEDPILCIDVTDTGIGMTAEQADKIFEPFSQASAATTRQFGGTGLGLTISKQLAGLLGGDLNVTSSQGVGTTFTLRLGRGVLEDSEMIEFPDHGSPVHTGNDFDKEHTGCAGAPSSSGEISGRVLLAEDNVVNRTLLLRILERYDIEIETVSDGGAAIEAVSAASDGGRPFDLVLMDMMMPILDGYAATSGIRQAGYRGAIVALTGNTQPDDRTKCLEAGCDDFLAKPIEREALEGVLARFVRE